MSAALSHNQKRYLSQLARRAWQAAEREVGDAESFRHQEVAAAARKHGLRCCDQDDYKRVEAHFLDLLGETGRALNAHVAAETEPKRQAEAVLRRELTRFGFQPGYAAAICARQFRCALADATAQQLWNLVYTIRNRGNARTKQAA